MIQYSYVGVLNPGRDNLNKTAKTKQQTLWCYIFRFNDWYADCSRVDGAEKHSSKAVSGILFFNES